jgi:hypothetical protein
MSADLVSAELDECLHSPICRSLKVFLLPCGFSCGPFSSALVSHRSPARFSGIKRSAMHKICFVSVFALLTFTLGSSRLGAATLQEDFSSNPLERGWSVTGSAHLFEWDPTAQHLRVTWDSSQPNSFFHRPLGVTLSRADDFNLSFKLRMESIEVGVNPAKPYTFQIGLGFLNVAEATNYFRGSGFNSPNLVEFNYFPDSGFGATISPVMICTNHEFASSFNFPLEMALEDLFVVQMSYSAAAQVLTTMITRNGEPFGPIDPVTFPEQFTDFAVNDFAISSYSDAGQHPDFGGSIRARGVVEDLRIVFPDPPLGRVMMARAGSHWTARFATRPGWTYTLERTDKFQTWTSVGTPAQGNGEEIVLADTAPLEGAGFYRVKANRE